MLGVPAYGYVNPSKATTLQHKRSLVRRQIMTDSNPLMTSSSYQTSNASIFDQAITATSEASEGLPLNSVPGTVIVKSEDGSAQNGQVQFNQIVSQGALLPARIGESGNAISFLAIGGFTRFWDGCSSTPFLTSPYANQVITYDDPQSLGEKASFARTAKILGTAVWDLSGDTAQWDLMNALRQGLGKTS